LSSYFTGKPDPQRDIKIKPDNPEYIQRWCDSIAKLDLRGIIFHNELSSNFTRSFANDNISFIRVKLGRYSTNDERFLHWLTYLKNTNYGYDNVLLTDVSDVIFVRNPFDFMELTNFGLYFGQEQRVIGDNATMVKFMTEFYGGVLYSDKRVLNAGTIGGKAGWIIKFLEYMETEIKRIGSLGNCNMSALNYTAYSKFKRSDFYAGRPFTSAFKAFESPDTTECYIVHK
jgi:hypothetical protein